MSDENKFFSEDDDLEAELRRLVPTQLKVNFLDELASDHRRIAMGRASQKQRSRQQWILPAIAGCLVVFGGAVLWKWHPASAGVERKTETAALHPPALQLPAPSLTEAPLGDRVFEPVENLVPVSSRGFLIHASSGGIVESELGPRQRFDFRFEDVDLWHDPNTSTNIRVFSPRQETITVPLPID